MEILTSKSEQAAPSQDWLKSWIAARADQKIRQRFSKERREEAIQRGKELRPRRCAVLPAAAQRTVTSESLLAVAQDFNRGDVAAL
ncbi:hypothetical protein QJS66_04200 [Kocuria rhizophila]|nr:hypothetical protein QJS66_04200 [Kocuria rhizophila]